ncbi:MAG: hypothetical protein IJI41_06065 [Anaerolineaceae bacterium]|nr:hypothetical protein [Anaerolineaceae bacterium]
MSDITEKLHLSGKHIPDHKMIFDINLLPLNLSDGRNIGNLPGFYVYKAPKKSDINRQTDILFLLFHVENYNISDSVMSKWADITADSYFKSRGTFTSGINDAIKKLSAFIKKDNNNKISPIISMNAILLRDRSIMIAHAGPVHTTIISSKSVKNFTDNTCLPIQVNQNNLCFFSSEIHPEDIILLCPKVPSDWTNIAILDVAGNSPLNAIRFLLDRSEGNIQSAVIQLKSGKGNITFRNKSYITTNIQAENLDNTYKKESDDYTLSTDKPLIRHRTPTTLKEFIQPTSKSDSNLITHLDDSVTEGINVTMSNPNMGRNDLPVSSDIPFDFTEDSNIESVLYKAHKPTISEIKSKRKISKSKTNSRLFISQKLNLRKLLIIITCGVIIPIFVISILFFIYSGRSKEQLHRENLSLAIAAAQKAIAETNLTNKESLWTESLQFVNHALEYGNSPAAFDLKKEAMEQIDSINGGITTIYNYANQNKLPQGIIINEIASSGQYTYALDQKSGSILRFTNSGNGLSIDNRFNCTPGTYSSLNDENNMIQIGTLIDFVILPTGSPHSFTLAGIDGSANILYCSSFTSNRASKLKLPEQGRLQPSNVTFSNNSLYVLDTKASTVWEYLYSNTDGFAYEPSNYYGSYSPYLSDVIDFAMYREYAFFLKENSNLLTCDYSGYRPDCKTITEIGSPDGSSHINFSNHKFRKILLNSSPDNSFYIMDAQMQSILNISAKSNFVRYIVPNRTIDDISQYSTATGFGIIDQNRLIWAYNNNLYIGNMP